MEQKPVKDIVREQKFEPKPWTQKQCEEMDEREFESEWADIHLPND